MSAKADAIHLVPLCILRISKGCRTKRGFCYCFGLKFAQWLVIAVRSIDSVSRIVFLLLHCIRRVSYRRTVIIVSADKVWVRNCSPPEFLKTTGFAGLYVLLSPQLLCSGSNYWLVVSNSANNGPFKKFFDKDLLMDILDASGTPLFVKNQQYQIILVNKALADLVGLDRDEMVGKTDFELYSYEEASAFTEVDERVFRTRAPYHYEEVITDSTNTIKALRTTKNVIETSSGELLLVGTVHDITELNAAQTQLEDAVNHLSLVAHTDALTGLSNRLKFESDLSELISNAADHQDQFSVLFVDLNGFKVINDTAGHLVGDEILKASSQRLRNQLRGDSKIARVGGDEFLILLPKTNVDTASQVVERVIDSFKEPINFEGANWNVSCSIGVALYPQDGDRGAELIRNADFAMYEAKRHKRSDGNVPCSSVKFFCSEFGDELDRRRQIEWALNFSESGSEIEQYYQPIVSCNGTDFQIRGFESLARWSLDGKCISPEEFIPILNNNGGIVPFGYKIIESACEFLTGLEEDQYVSVNLTYKQILDKSFCDKVEAVIRRAGINPNRLAFELTEQDANIEKAIATSVFDNLKRIGVQTMIDDFGCGYSNLGRICDLPNDFVKIDKSLVRNSRLLKSVLSLLRELGFFTIVEGIETEEQASNALLFGADMLQGFYFGSPQPANYDWKNRFMKPQLPISLPIDSVSLPGSTVQ